MTPQAKFTSLLCAVTLVAACQAQPTPIVAVAQNTEGAPTSANMDLTEEVKRLIPAKPYTGPIRIVVDTGLLTGGTAKPAQRRVLSLSNKHNDGDIHAAAPSGRYFDPDAFPTELDSLLGDSPMPDGSSHEGRVAVNGKPGEAMTGLVQFKFRQDASGSAALEAFKARYSPTILQNVDGHMVARLDLSKIKLSEFQANLEKYNTLSPVPIKDLAFSSIAAAQTAAAILDMNANYSLQAHYIQPVSMPHAPYPKANNVIGTSPYSAERIIDSHEGFNRASSPTTTGSPQSLNNFKWMRAMSIPQSRLHSTGYGAKIAIIDGGFGRNFLRDVPPHRIIEKKNFHNTWWFGGDDADQAMPGSIAGTMSFAQRFHGTFALSAAGSGEDDGFGSAGVAPRASLMQLRSTYPYEHYEAVKYAVSKGADVILIDQDAQLTAYERHWATASIMFVVASITGGLTREYLLEKAAGGFHDAVKLATDAGITFVAPAGNSGYRLEKLTNLTQLYDESKQFIFPACLPDALTVGGSDAANAPENNFGKIWDDGGEGSQSNYGPAIDLYAPANIQYVTGVSFDPDSDGELKNFGGTSGASPAVAGVVGLMKSKNRTLSRSDIRNLLLKKFRYTVVAPDGSFAPLVDANAVLEAIQSPHRETRNITGTPTQEAIEIRGKIEMENGSPVLVRDDICPPMRVRLEPMDALSPILIPTHPVYYDFGAAGQRWIDWPNYEFVHPGFSSPPLGQQVKMAGWFDASDPNRFEIASVREMATPAAPVTCYRIVGTVSDAVTGGGIAGVNVEMRADVEACDGNVMARTQTDESGQYAFVDVNEGNYTVTVNRDGYVQVCSRISVNSSNPTGSGGSGLVTTTSLPDNATRFVLIWGAYPKDLDAHLTGPTADGGRFHVYWGNGAYADSGVNVTLDRDDRFSYGPETVTNTVYSNQSGVFRYAVHDYTNVSAQSSTELSHSGASVLVFRGNQLVATFQPPAGQPGNIWNVLEMDGRTGAIYAVNQMSNGSDPAYVIQSLPGFGDLTRLIKGLPPKL